MDEETQHLQRRLEIHQRNLRLLQAQAAVYGSGREPVALLDQVDEEKKVIARLEKEIEEKQSAIL